ncbi:MAG: pilus assembly protein [Sideroxyarcus sp.]|nr:pilus assembly protein [Sideroxyarcus sp.]
MTSSMIPKRLRPPSLVRARALRFGRQTGAFAVEFSIVALFFLTMVFTIIELSRALYLWNALQEVTRRAARDAAVTDFSDASAIEQIQQKAIFRNSAGKLSLGDPVNEQYVRIDYLSLQNESNRTLKAVPIPSGSLPACPTRNKITCTAKSGDANCIRMVRVRICQPGGGSACSPVPYQPLLPLVNFAINLPVAETVVRAESLGYLPGMASCD